MNRNSVLPEYLSQVSDEMKAQSDSIARSFSTHHLSSGENKEDLVKKFLTKHLPQRFHITNGLIFSSGGLFSNQADILIADRFNNAPLYGGLSHEMWPVEAIYSMIEVKSMLDKNSIKDAAEKCKKFKSLPRRFCNPVNLSDSLFVLWAFDSISEEMLCTYLEEENSRVPCEQRIDQVIVLGKAVGISGAYLELSRLGQPNSEYRAQLIEKHGSDYSKLMPHTVEIHQSGNDALFAWFLWFDSWLRRNDFRLADPMEYIPEGTMAGRRVYSRSS